MFGKLSIASRLTSHRNESAPSLFHSSIGSFNPLAVAIHLDESGENDDPDKLMARMGALLHERHHWLQQIGTTAGAFSSTLLDLQSVTIGNLPLHKIEINDVPLIRGRFSADPLLAYWERLEATRRLLTGCRVGDYKALIEDGRSPSFTLMTENVARLMNVTFGDPLGEVMSSFLRHDLNPPRESPLLLSDRGWLIGSRHLMETAASISELFRVADWERQKVHEFNFEPRMLNIDHLFRGVYGVVSKIFLNEIKTINVASLVGLAFACDRALNNLYPPFFPASGRYVSSDWSPATTFARIVQALTSFNFERSLDYRDPDEVRNFLASLNDHIGGGDVLDLVHGTISAFLVDFSPNSTAESLYEISASGPPRSVAPGGRAQYTLSLVAEALRTRKGVPEFIVFPACHYLADRKKFHTYFDPIAAPLFVSGREGIGATRDQAGWVEFFLSCAVEGEILRALVMDDVSTIVKKLKPYLTVYGHGPEYGLSIIGYTLENLLGPSALMIKIYNDLAEECGKKSPS